MKKPPARGVAARDLAWEILMRVDTGKTLLEIALQETLEASRLNEPDRRLAERIIKGVLEQRSLIDAKVGHFLRDGFTSVPPGVRNVLRVGAYQILFLDRIRPEIAVNESVNLAKRVCGEKFARVVNAVLRKVATAAQEPVSPQVLPRTVEGLAAALSHPEWIVSRWVAEVGFEEAEKLCVMNNQEWPTGAHINSLRGAPERLWEQVRADGVEVEPGRFLSECFVFRRVAEQRRLSELSSFMKGFFTIQDESACLVCRALDPQPGEFVVDLCAAPGGKSAYMAELMRNKGRVLAVDVSGRRLKMVRVTCERLGATIVESMLADGISLELTTPADRVLVDAPCSGLGTLGRKKDVRWNTQPEDLMALHPLQRALLDSAARLVRVGGILCYATCSTDRSENEAIVEAFLKERASFRRRRVGHIDSAILSPDGDVRIWPQRHGLSGAYAAVLERVS